MAGWEQEQWLNEYQQYCEEINMGSYKDHYSGGSSEYLAAEDLKGKAVEITPVAWEDVNFNKEGEDDPKQKKLALSLKDKEKKFVVGFSNAKRFAEIHNSDLLEDWMNKPVVIMPHYYESLDKWGIVVRMPEPELSDDVPF